MGDGLKRAFAAAARTRADASLTPEMRRFLERLVPFTEPQFRGAVGAIESIADKAARTKCVKFGYAEQAQREDGRWGWQILPLGRKMLAAQDPALSRDGRGE